MARKAIYGLKYFPIMVNIGGDSKVLRAELYAGDESEEILPTIVKLFIWIYGKEGYFMQWGEDDPLIFAKENGGIQNTEKYIRLVECLLRSKFFSQDMFDKYGILTSHGIQVQWKEIKESVKSKLQVNPKYLINAQDEVINDDIEVITSEVNDGETESIPQSKVNKSKVTYLPTSENSKKIPEEPDRTPSLVAAPKIDPGHPDVDDDNPFPLSQCLEYIFKLKRYEENTYKLCFNFGLYKKGTTEIDLDKLFAWGKSFNRFMQLTQKNKTIKGWLTHFGNWLPQQPRSINPDELNMRNNEKPADTKSQKVLGNDPAKAGNFYHRPVILPGDIANAEAGTGHTEGEVQ